MIETKIKTIWNNIKSNDNFDRSVNECLREGYKIQELKIIPNEEWDETLLYACMMKG